MRNDFGGRAESPPSIRCYVRQKARWLRWCTIEGLRGDRGGESVRQHACQHACLPARTFRWNCWSLRCLSIRGRMAIVYMPVAAVAAAERHIDGQTDTEARTGHRRRASRRGHAKSDWHLPKQSEVGESWLATSDDLKVPVRLYLPPRTQLQIRERGGGTLASGLSRAFNWASDKQTHPHDKRRTRAMNTQFMF